MAQLLDNVLDSLQQKLETQLDSAVGIDLRTARETESDEDEPGDVKALRARARRKLLTTSRGDLVLVRGVRTGDTCNANVI